MNTIWKKLSLLSLTLLAIIGCFVTKASGENKTDEFVRVEIYYYGWETQTLTRLAMDDVRSAPAIRTIIAPSVNPVAKGEIDALISWLRVGDMKLVSNKDVVADGGEDPRLVIDFIRQDNTRVTYYASFFHLITEDNKKKRPIDDAFRDKFRFRK